MPWWHKETDNEEPLLNKTVDENSGLLPVGDENRRGPSSSWLYANFITMTTMFSVTHGTVVSCLSYASAELGTDMGSYGSFTLMFVYAFAAILLSKPIASQLGGKWALFTGIAGYCLYVGGFLFAIIVKSGAPTLAWIVYIITCIIGGLSGGLLWTAQGRYFTKNSKLYSEALREEVEAGEAPNGITIEDTDVLKTNGKFAGVFALIYLGVEALTKISATIIFLTCGSAAAYIVFIVYTASAVAGAVFFLGCSDLGDKGNAEVTFEETLRGAGDAASLLREDKRLMFMMPYQWSFGVSAAFVTFYINGTIIAGSDSLGDAWVGLLSAIITITGASMALPVAYITAQVGKTPVMIFGGVCLGFVGFITYFVSDGTLGTFAWIVPLLIVFGMGRGSWENTNKAVIADLYTDTPEQSTSAFANVNFSGGISGAFAYLVFGLCSRTVMATIVVVIAVLAIAGYMQAMTLHNRIREYQAAFEKQQEDPIEA